MNDWRDEPPDSAGWWLWRAKRGAEPFRVRVGKRLTVLASDYRRDVMWPPTEMQHLARGQWLRVPE